MTTIEEIPNTQVEDNDGPPDLEDAPTLEDAPALGEGVPDLEEQEAQTEEGAAGKKQSKYEKKNKKALAKAGLKQFPGVVKVQIKSGGKVRKTNFNVKK
jgi:hypothetical protein